MNRGPMEFVVVEFPTSTIDERFAGSLRDIVAAGLVRIVDVVVVKRDDGGASTVLEFADVEPETTQPYADVIHSIEGLIADEDVDEVAEQVRPGSSALIVLLEHRWLSGIAAAMADAGGRVVLAERIPAPDVERVLTERAAS